MEKPEEFHFFKRRKHEPLRRKDGSFESNEYSERVAKEQQIESGDTDVYEHWNDLWKRFGKKTEPVTSEEDAMDMIIDAGLSVDDISPQYLICLETSEIEEVLVAYKKLLETDPKEAANLLEQYRKTA